MISPKLKSYKKGLWAESIATAYLILKGYKILERRYKTPVGEIDIIAHKDNSLIIVEVKARSELAVALESVTSRNKNRVERAAGYYMALNHDLAGSNIRFDIFAFAGLFCFQHLDNAWRPRS